MSGTREIRVAFPITASVSSFGENHVGEQTIRQVAAQIFRQADRHADETDDRYIVELRRAAESLRLMDRNKRVLDVRSDFYRAYVMDRLQFIVAEVFDMEVYGNRDCYIRMRFSGNDKDYYGTAQIPAEMYYRLFDSDSIDEKRPIYLIGTCVRKEYKVGAIKRWDKYSMKIQVKAEVTTKKKTKMLHFYLGNHIGEENHDR